METLRDTLEGIVMDGDTIQFILSHDRDIEVARRIFPTVLHYSNHPKSIYDFGCGIGTWTKALIELGFKDTVLGLDVPNIQKNGLTIPDKNFKPLGEVKSLEKRDLCISTRIDTIASGAEKYLYIKSLIALSPVILFLSKTIISYLSKIQTIYPKIQFWPTFEEINFIKLGDPMDKAIYGCSLFSALNLQCKIYGTEDNKHYIVFDISDKRYFYSIEDDDLYQGTKLDLLLTKGVKFKYAFDQEEYIMLD